MQARPSSYKMNQCMNPLEDPRESRRCPPNLERVVTSLETLRGTRSSMFQKVTMPDSS